MNVKNGNFGFPINDGYFSDSNERRIEKGSLRNKKIVSLKRISIFFEDIENVSVIQQKLDFLKNKFNTVTSGIQTIFKILNQEIITHIRFKHIPIEKRKKRQTGRQKDNNY